MPPPLMVRGSRVGGPPEVAISGSTLSAPGQGRVATFMPEDILACITMVP